MLFSDYLYRIWFRRRHSPLGPEIIEKRQKQTVANGVLRVFLNMYHFLTYCRDLEILPSLFPHERVLYSIPQSNSGNTKMHTERVQRLD